MKYSVILTDGAADYPVPELDGKTPFEVAKKPCIDALAKKSELGMLHVTPDGCKGGSEIGNLCVMGYDPRVYLTGRSPLEARSLGIEMSETDLALRCNLVTLSADEPYEQKTMVDNTASEISTEDAKALMDDVQKEFGSDDLLCGYQLQALPYHAQRHGQNVVHPAAQHNRKKHFRISAERRLLRPFARYSETLFRLFDKTPDKRCSCRKGA